MALLAGPRLLGQTRSSDEDIQGPDKFERVPIWCFYNEFVHSGAFLPGMLAELAVKGVEIEPHLCYHRKSGVQEHRLLSQMENPGSKRYK